MRVLFLESHAMWIHGLPNGFRDAGHIVKISGPLTEKNIPQMISEFCPDLIVNMGWGPENSSIEHQKWIGEHVSASKIPQVYWATEDPTHTHTFTLPYLSNVQPDFVFTICSANVDYYRSLGIKAAHLDFGFHPSVHNPTGHHDAYHNSIAVVANAYPRKLHMYPNHYRHHSLHTLLTPLLEKNIQIDLYGRNWEEMKPYLGTDIPSNWIHGYIPYTEANQVYSSSSIIIGIQNHPTQLTQRTYEILGSGGFLLTNDIPEIRRLFNPGHDLVVSSSPEETVRLVQHYLEHPKEQKQIAEQGKLAVAIHSYRHRAEYMIDVLQKEEIFEGNKSIYDLLAIDNALHTGNTSGCHIVRNGDTLWSISNKYRVPITTIQKLNELETHRIYAGQLLKIQP